MIRGLCALVLAASLLAVSASARVVLVGVDGASWSVIDPLLAAGELPSLSEITERGVTAELETVEPVNSPTVWTSIATGRSPEAHGVTDFLKTAVSLQVPTIFERLAAQGRLENIKKIHPPSDWKDTVPRTLIQPGYKKPDKDTA